MLEVHGIDPPPVLRTVKYPCSVDPPEVPVNWSELTSSDSAGRYVAQSPMIPQSAGGAVPTNRGSGSVADAFPFVDTAAKEILEEVSAALRLPSGRRPMNVGN